MKYYKRSAKDLEHYLLKRKKSKGLKQLATRRFKILSDENRRTILNFLIPGPHSVTEISESLGIERTLVSHHLKVLKDEHLVVSERQGKEIFYSVVEELIVDKNKLLLDFECCRIQFR